MKADQVQFVDEKERELFATVLLAEDVREFLGSSVGRYLHHRAKQQILQAEIDSLAIDPDGLRGWLYARRKLRIARQRAATARCFINWLGDAIVDGNNAEAALREYREPT